MTDNNYTAIGLLVDRSGSMYPIATESSAAINAFVADQAAQPGRRSVFLAEFDNIYDVVRTTCPPNAFVPYTLVPRGLTALHDAIGKMITDFGKELAGMPEDQRPGHVVVGIMTDGGENSSQEWTAEKVRELVEQQSTVYGWHFLFMGANQDAVMTGGQLGFTRDSSITYSASPAGTRSVLDSMNTYTASAFAGTTPRVSDEDRKKAVAE